MEFRTLQAWEIFFWVLSILVFFTAWKSLEMEKSSLELCFSRLCEESFFLNFLKESLKLNNIFLEKCIFFHISKWKFFWGFTSEQAWWDLWEEEAFHEKSAKTKFFFEKNEKLEWDNFIRSSVRNNNCLWKIVHVKKEFKQN